MNNLAAIILEGALKARAHFVPVGEVVGDGDNLLVFQFLCGIFGKRVGALRRRRCQANKPGARVALRHILRRRNAQSRYFLFGEEVGNRKRLKGGERANNAMNIILFDQFLRFGACGCGNAGRICNNQFDFAAG